MTKYEIKLIPRSEREAAIQKRLEASPDKDILWDFRGDKATTLTVVRLPVDLPVYRVDNCRTYSEQQDAIAKDGLDKNYFAKGQELTTAQGAQHAILVKLANKEASVSPIMKVLETEGQRFPLLITSTGVVVNGNRRLSAMRELYAADQSPNSRYAYVNCMVLPSDTTPDEIDDIEAYEQARPETKLDYDWIGDAQLVRRQVNKGRNTKVVATQLRRGEADIRNLLQSIEEADLYLNEWVKKPGQYSLVSGDGEQIFGDLPKRLLGQSVPLQSASRAIAWSLFDNRDKVPGRIYAYNAAFGKLARVVLASIAEQLDLPVAANADTNDDDGSFSVDIGGSEGPEDYSSIIAALRHEETRDDAVEALIEGAICALERDRGQKNKKAAFNALVQIHSKLAGIDLATAGIDTYGGMGKQLESIKELLGRLDKKLSALKQSPAADADK